MVTAPWQEVKANTVANCFTKARISVVTEPGVNEEEHQEPSNPPDATEACDAICANGGAPENVALEELLYADSDAVSKEEISDVTLVETVQDHGDGEGSSEADTFPLPTAKEGGQAAGRKLTAGIAVGAEYDAAGIVAGTLDSYMLDTDRVLLRYIPSEEAPQESFKVVIPHSLRHGVRIARSSNWGEGEAVNELQENPEAAGPRPHHRNDCHLKVPAAMARGEDLRRRSPPPSLTTCHRPPPSSANHHSPTPPATPAGKKRPSRRDMTTWAFQQGQDPPVAFATSRSWHEQRKVVNGVNEDSFPRVFHGRPLSDQARASGGVTMPPDSKVL
ncbi:hypothetical protein HPB50_009102 [Hyalomma asiaticum]|uniref:Uncharacterized protein n=1 Tax=Hyalomma asiaticum TaxID=266040 RepID=A0ACB7T450_HYAAI|nr:hypothetical protein HPB50_009102 [Hyalomma asiaticum]